jgi:cysteine desulfurase/selenocysteine lyase
MEIETSEQDVFATGKQQDLDVKKIRSDFPMLKEKINGKPLIYFDSASTNHKPQVLIDRLVELYTKEYGKTEESHTYGKRMTEAYEETRARFAKFLNAREPKEVVFTSSCTASINLVANGFARTILKAGDEVVISMLEHHSNIVPWQMACEQTGAKLVVAPIKDTGELDMEAYANLLSDKTKIVSICHSSNVLGTITPIEEIVQLAHAKGIPVLIDGAQTAPHMKVDMQEIDCEYFVFSVHKMGGPAGIGVLYGKSDWLDKLPPQWGGEAMADSVTFTNTSYKPVPKKFEAGTPPFEEIVACGVLIGYIEALGMDKTEQYEEELMLYAEHRLAEIEQVKIYGTAPVKEPVVSFDLPGMDVKELERYLNDEFNIAVKAGELTAQPLMKHLGVKGLLRLAFCYYNTREEIDIFMDALEAFIAKKQS